MNHEPMKTTALAIAAAFAMTACEDPEVPPQPVPSATAPTASVAPPPPPPPAPTVPTGHCDAPTELALQTAIEARAKKEVQPGAKPVGTAVSCEQLAEGGTLTVPVNLQSGKCYTVIAHSMGNVTELDVFLKLNAAGAPPAVAALNPVLGQDAETGPTASIGGGSSCYKQAIPLIPIAAQVEATAKVGNGPVAVRVYER